MLRKDYKLLPHVRQDLYGFNAQSMQMYPWAIKQFDVEKAWRFSEGEQVNVAVIDTGCDLTHEDLKECLLPGKNFIDHNSEPQDDNGHGTHVAGTIAAINNGIGMVGVAPKAKILPVKSLAGNGAGSHVSIADGVRWSVDNGAELITMSLGSPMPSKTLERAINYAINNNVVVFCAAGNSGNSVDIQYPANFLPTISIGAIGRKLNVSSFSCCGDNLDFVAPGEDIISAVPGDRYAKMTGTSMATPYAVGCAALYLSLKKKINPNIKLDKNDFVKTFIKNAIPIVGQHSGDTRYQGNGIIRPMYDY